MGQIDDLVGDRESVCVRERERERDREREREREREIVRRCEGDSQPIRLVY